MAESRTGWFRARSGAGLRRIGRARARTSRDAAPDQLLRRALLHPRALALGAIALAFSLCAAWLISWTRDRFVPLAGRTMDETRLVRVDFTLRDAEATGRAKDAARQRAPHVFLADDALLESLRTSLEQLPQTLAEAATLAEVAEDVAAKFGLDEATLAAIHRRTGNEVAAAEWRAAVVELMDLLSATPLLASDTIQREQQSSTAVIELRAPDHAPIRTHIGRAINLTSERAREEALRLVRRAGFPQDVAPAIARRILHESRPTFLFDERESQRLADAEAALIQPVLIEHKRGETLAHRGDVLTDARRETLIQERDAFAELRSNANRWGRRIGAFGAAMLITLGLGGYLLVFRPGLGAAAATQTDRTMQRIGAIAGLTLLTAAVSCLGSVYNPGLLPLLCAGPTVLVAVAFTIGLGRRAALALGVGQALIPAFALGPSASNLLVAIAGVGAVVGALREIRNRRSLIVAGAASGFAMSIAVAAAALLERPVRAWTNDLPTDAAWAMFAGVLVSFVALGLLPVVERLFGVATGMTLIELRDPKNPLLRELAQRAPGTYTHSLTVATLAEAAADSIGADALHVYVGALYHDIGKMIKPAYFVENQAGGFSRHEKLSPAMSLLVIVGHVKDGLELAREHRLPESLRHYIESHHGTTLVEYFYNRARERAGADDDDQPTEFGYRYPGPKPQTREAAILMLCDAVESASRALAEPNPSRIESLVGAISGMRLTDGQFDECGLTLTELHAVERSVIKSLNSIYHARISYRSTESLDGKPPTRTAPAVAGAGATDAGASPA